MARKKKKAPKKRADGLAKDGTKRGRRPKTEEQKLLKTSVQLSPDTVAAIDVLRDSFPEGAQSRSGAVCYLCDSAIKTAAVSRYSFEAVRRVIELVRRYKPELEDVAKALLEPLAEQHRSEMVEAFEGAEG